MLNQNCQIVRSFGNTCHSCLSNVGLEGLFPTSWHSHPLIPVIVQLHLPRRITFLVDNWVQLYELLPEDTIWKCATWSLFSVSCHVFPSLLYDGQLSILPSSAAVVCSVLANLFLQCKLEFPGTSHNLNSDDKRGHSSSFLFPLFFCVCVFPAEHVTLMLERRQLVPLTNYRWHPYKYLPLLSLQVPGTWTGTT